MLWLPLVAFALVLLVPLTILLGTAWLFGWRFQPVDTGSMSPALRVGDLARSWAQASPALRLASVVAELAEILKGSYWAKDGDLDRLAVLAQKVSAEFAGRNRGADVAEFAALVGKAGRLK